MIVAIDGPAGAGKSTVARLLAERLGFRYLDTGAMYRAVTWLAVRRGLDLDDGAPLGRLAQHYPVQLDEDGRVTIADEDVTQAIRLAEIDRLVPTVARHPEVRRVMRLRQRELADLGNAVIEGRDIGTVVVPDADVKVYLNAEPEVRARRRQLERLPGKVARPEITEDAIRVAVLGRPNVGKSSLVNALVGQDRVIVSEVPGTTRDSVDTVLRRGDRTFVLVDTAGLRRKRRQRQGIEYYSELRALQAAERADVALVLVDASEGLVDQDLAVADVARKAQDSTLVVASKWDIAKVGIEDLRPRLQDRLKQRPPLVAVSAKTGRGINRLLDRIEELYEKHTTRISTGQLNRFLAELREARQPPSRNGKRLNLLYGTQTQVRPPRFRFFVNDPGLVTRDYGYWVENQLRDRFELDGVPVSIDFVRRA
jgi:cytidylate kinase